MCCVFLPVCKFLIKRRITIYCELSDERFSTTLQRQGWSHIQLPGSFRTYCYGAESWICVPLHPLKSYSPFVRISFHLVIRGFSFFCCIDLLEVLTFQLEELRQPKESPCSGFDILTATVFYVELKPVTLQFQDTFLNSGPPCRPVSSPPDFIWQILRLQCLFLFQEKCNLSLCSSQIIDCLPVLTAVIVNYDDFPTSRAVYLLLFLAVRILFLSLFSHSYDVFPTRLHLFD